MGKKFGGYPTHWDGNFMIITPSLCLSFLSFPVSSLEFCYVFLRLDVQGKFCESKNGRYPKNKWGAKVVEETERERESKEEGRKERKSLVWHSWCLREGNEAWHGKRGKEEAKGVEPRKQVEIRKGKEGKMKKKDRAEEKWVEGKKDEDGE